MKQTLLLIGFLAIGARLSAQSIKIDVNGGQTLSTMVETESPYAKTIQHYAQTTTNGYIAGLHVGATATVDLGNFSVQTGLSYQNKGSSNNVTIQFVGITNGAYFLIRNYYNLNYLEIPLNVLYNIPVKTNKLYIGAGVYNDIGVAGKVTYMSTDYVDNTGFNGERRISFGDQADIHTPIYGISILAGVHLDNGLSMGGAYQFSVTNISGDFDIVGKERTFNFTIAYTLFDKIKFKK